MNKTPIVESAMSIYTLSKKQKICLFLLLFISISISKAQNSEQAIQFSQFTGPVYYMPKMTLKEGKWKKINFQEFYSDTIYSYEQIGEIQLDALNIPNSKIETSNFPGVERKTRFCMVLKSEATVNNSGCYEISLSSDDGSRLWLEGKQIIDNDGGHGMRTKKDTLFLEEGVYDTKVWYFQGLPFNFGLIMETLKFDNDSLCIDTISNAPPKQYLLKGALFKHDKYSLSPDNLNQLQRIADTINIVKPSKLKIIGHTDDTGTAQYNLDLSLKRATSVANKIARLIDSSNINIIIEAKGSQVPMATNETEEGRQLNRRVEIIFVEN